MENEWKELDFNNVPCDLFVKNRYELHISREEMGMDSYDALGDDTIADQMPNIQCGINVWGCKYIYRKRRG